MADELPTNDSEAKNIKHFLEVLGGVLIATAGQPMIVSLTATPRVLNPIEIGLSVVGLLLLCTGFFWKPQPGSGNKFIRSLADVSSDARSYIIIIFLAWTYMATSSVVSQLRQNNEMVGLRNDEQSIARVIDKAVLPRHLTNVQQAAISSFLLQFNPSEYSFEVATRDQEADGFRADIEQALIKGGWTRASTRPYEYKDDVPEGLSLNFIRTQEDAQKSGDPRNPKPDRLLMMALGLAGVRLDQSGGGGDNNVTEDRLVIGIGKRRMDTYAQTCPEP